jgi:hypothetical protein
MDTLDHALNRRFFDEPRSLDPSEYGGFIVRYQGERQPALFRERLRRYLEKCAVELFLSERAIGKSDELIWWTIVQRFGPLNKAAIFAMVAERHTGE